MRTSTLIAIETKLETRELESQALEFRRVVSQDG